jgi:hypothetical protein
MRRIYYRFPQRVDLSFTFGLPFTESLKHIITELDGAQSTKTNGKELVQVKTSVEIAADRTSFCDVSPDLLRPGVITEAVDLRVSLLALALRGGGKVPIANDVFFIRLSDRHSNTEIDIAKEGNTAGLDALDIKNLILGRA